MLSVAFSPKGNTIVSASGDIFEQDGTNTIKVWDAGASALIPLNPQPKTDGTPAFAASLELKAEKQSAHSDYVCSVAFSPDGTTILSGSGDEAIKLWDAGFLVRGYR